MIPFAIISVTAIIVAKRLPHIYKASGTILINTQKIAENMTRNKVVGFVEERIKSIGQQIMQYDNMLDIIRRFGLDKDKHGKKYKKKELEDIVDKMRKDIKLEMISAEVPAPRIGTTNISVAYIVSYSGTDPKKVLDITNYILSEYVEYNSQRRKKITKSNSETIQDAINSIKKQLEEKGKTIKAFKEKYSDSLPQLYMNNVKMESELFMQIQNIDKEIENLKESKSYLDRQLATINPTISKPKTFVENQLSDEEQLDILEKQEKKLLTVYTPKHPEIIRTREQIEVYKKKIGEKIGTNETTLENVQDKNPVYSNLEIQIKSTELRIQGMLKKKKELQSKRLLYVKRLDDAPMVEKAYTDITRGYMSLSEVYEEATALLVEAQQAEIAGKGKDSEEFIILERPRLPERPIKPNRKAIALIGIVLGLITGVGLAAIVEDADTRIRTRDNLVTLAEIAGLKKENGDFFVLESPRLTEKPIKPNRKVTALGLIT